MVGHLMVSTVPLHTVYGGMGAGPHLMDQTIAGCAALISVTSWVLMNAHLPQGLWIAA